METAMRGRPILCSLCAKVYRTHGATRVRNLVVFQFCFSCIRLRREECDAFMDQQAGKA